MLLFFFFECLSSSFFFECLSSLSFFLCSVRLASALRFFPILSPLSSSFLLVVGSRCRRFTASLPSLHVRAFVRPRVRHIGVLCSPSIAYIYRAYPSRHKAAKDAAPPARAQCGCSAMRGVAFLSSFTRHLMPHVVSGLAFRRYLRCFSLSLAQASNAANCIKLAYLCK